MKPLFFELMKNGTPRPWPVNQMLPPWVYRLLF
jgi:hypothetical protein